MLDTRRPRLKAHSNAREQRSAEHVSQPSWRRPDARLQARAELVGRFAAAYVRGDIDAVVSLLTDDAWVRMPPQPDRVPGPQAIAALLRDRAIRRGAQLRLVPTRANGQPAYGVYLADAHAAITAPTRSSCSRSKATASPR